MSTNSDQAARDRQAADAAAQRDAAQNRGPRPESSFENSQAKNAYQATYNNEKKK